MTKENGINFLLYSLLGVTLENREQQDIILDAAIRRAYQDASRHVLSFAVGKEEKYWMKRAASEKMKEAIKDRTKICDKEGLTYNDWHEKLCDELRDYFPKDKMDDNYPFTVGIAQKWINMTMKYLCAMRVVFGKSDALDELLGDVERELHVPIDSFILEAVSKKRIPILQKKDGNYGGYSGARAWSTYTDYKEEYAQLQEKIAALVGDQMPLDWENPKWIEISQNRRETENKREYNRMAMAREAKRKAENT